MKTENQPAAKVVPMTPEATSQMRLRALNEGMTEAEMVAQERPKGSRTAKRPARPVAQN